jgi:septal ring factor EnvC (AmiA/AmiB activator)
MLALIEMTLNIFLFTAILAVALSVGFIAGTLKLNKIKRQIGNLENEMLNSHAEILRLQKELSDKDINQPQAPVFSIRSTAELSKDNLPDSTSNKKALPGRSKPKL